MALYYISKMMLRGKSKFSMAENKDGSTMNEKTKETIIEDNNNKKREEFNERLKHLDKIENTKEMHVRYNRYEVFDKFQGIAKNAFESLRDSDHRGRIYEAFNMLNVCPGSRMGMDKRDIVEVFWGSKVYDSEYKDNSGVRFKFNTETGATLYFLRKDNGLVSIYLFPSITEKRKFNEDGILLKDDIEPKKLLSKFFQKRLWQSFMAYTEVTALDGSPSLWQRIRVAKNRFVKPIVVDGVVCQRVIVQWLVATLSWVIGVGLSGCLVTAFYDWKNDDDKKLSQNFEKIDGTLKHNSSKDSLAMIKISEQIDSLNLKVAEFIGLQKQKK